jgi:urease accessory protein
MLLIEKMAPIDAPATEELVLTFDQRCKSRLRTRLRSGEEAGLFLERGTVLRGGDKLLGNDGRVVEIIAAPEQLMETQSYNPQLLARAAYHLGNRHLAVDIRAGLLRFTNDHVIGDMVRGLGLSVEEITAPFEPESGAYGAHGSHTHAHEASPIGHSADGEGRGPRIHDMATTPVRKL